MGWKSAKSCHLFTEVNMVMPLLLYHSWCCANKVQFFLKTSSCWNLFPEFLSNRPHITELGKCQNVIWSDWILIWWSCIWKLRSTLKKNYLCSQFAFLFSTKAVIPSFRSFVPKDACKKTAIQEFCCSLLPQLMAQFNSDCRQTKK